uniref:Uncharacterized protein n=1 Tax=Glossina pallidipes TaxID=7398 RepID=A0A1A9ZRN8_GLOPL
MSSVDALEKHKQECKKMHLERSATQLKNHKTAKKHNKQLNPFAEGNTQFITWSSTPPQQHARNPQHEYHSGHIRSRSDQIYLTPRLAMAAICTTETIEKAQSTRSFDTKGIKQRHTVGNTINPFRILNDQMQDSVKSNTGNSNSRAVRLEFDQPRHL